MKVPPHTLYVMRGDALTKIGITNNPGARLRDLQPDGAISVERTWVRPKDCRRIETVCKRWLADRRTTFRAEWFDVTVEEAVDTVERAIQYVEGIGPPRYRILRSWPLTRPAEYLLRPMRAAGATDEQIAVVVSGMRIGEGLRRRIAGKAEPLPRPRRGGKIGQPSKLIGKRRARAIALLKAGKTVTETARALGIVPGTLYNQFGMQMIAALREGRYDGEE